MWVIISALSIRASTANSENLKRKEFDAEKIKCFVVNGNLVEDCQWATGVRLLPRLQLSYLPVWIVCSYTGLARSAAQSRVGSNGKNKDINVYGLGGWEFL